MKVAVVLGNKINDDGTFSSIMVNRLDLAIRFYKNFSPDKIIVSGGQANPKTPYTEAELMKKYLVSHGIPEDVIVEENKSMTTEENVLFSMPIARKLGATCIIAITTLDHYLYPYYNFVELFADELHNEDVELMFYTNTYAKKVEY